MTGLDPAKDREFLEAKAKEIGPFEEQWVNGDSAAKSEKTSSPPVNLQVHYVKICLDCGPYFTA